MYHSTTTSQQSRRCGRAGGQERDAQLLAGGQTLVAAMKLRLASPSDLIDLGSVTELRGIKVDGGNLTIGAMTRHAEVAASKDVKKAIPALARAGRHDRRPQVRNMGTLGGSLANNDPAADYPAAVLGLGATINTNKRKIAADDFFKGMYETALQPGEIITSITFPGAQARRLREVQEPGLALRHRRRVRGRAAAVCASP